MRWHFIFVMALLAFILPSCAHSISSSSGVNLGGEELGVEMWASTNCVQPGDHVTLRATVTNNTSKPQVIDLQNQPVLDIWLSDGSTVLARWSDGKSLTSDLTRLELKPGESKTIDMDWTVTQPKFGTVLAAQARFIDNPRFPPLMPSVLVNVSICPGPFGPIV